MTDLIIAIIIASVFMFVLIVVPSMNKIRLQTVTFFSGGLGSGKTLLLTRTAIKIYKQRKILNFLTFGLVKKAEIYSNYPIVLHRSRKKVVYSHILKKEHILGQIRLPEGCIVVLDEASSMFPNQPKKSAFEVSHALRWFRHWTGGYLLMADQSIGSIDIEVRRRVNVVYNLHSFGKFLFFFYRVGIERLSYMEDVPNFTNIRDIDKKPTFTYGILPRKRYASRYMRYQYNPMEDLNIKDFKDIYIR